MRYDTDDSILMNRHRQPSLEPIYTGHLEPMRVHTPEKVNPVVNLILIGLGILIAGAILAAVLPHP